MHAVVIPIEYESNREPDIILILVRRRPKALCIYQESRRLKLRVHIVYLNRPEQDIVIDLDVYATARRIREVILRRLVAS